MRSTLSVTAEYAQGLFARPPAEKRSRLPLPPPNTTGTSALGGARPHTSSQTGVWCTAHALTSTTCVGRGAAQDSAATPGCLLLALTAASRRACSRRSRALSFSSSCRDCAFCGGRGGGGHHGPTPVSTSGPGTGKTCKELLAR